MIDQDQCKQIFLMQPNPTTDYSATKRKKALSTWIYILFY